MRDKKRIAETSTARDERRRKGRGERYGLLVKMSDMAAVFYVGGKFGKSD